MVVKTPRFHVKSAPSEADCAEKLTLAEAAERGYASYLTLLLAIRDGVIIAEADPAGDVIVGADSLAQVFGQPKHHRGEPYQERCGVQHIPAQTMEESRRLQKGDAVRSSRGGEEFETSSRHDPDAHFAGELRRELELRHEEISKLLALLREERETSRSELDELSGELAALKAELEQKQRGFLELSTKTDWERREALQQNAALEADIQLRVAEIASLSEKVRVLEEEARSARDEARLEREKLYLLLEELVRRTGTEGSTSSPSDQTLSKTLTWSALAMGFCVVLLGGLIGVAAFHIWFGRWPVLTLFHQ
jgi:hypothetical protein